MVEIDQNRRMAWTADKGAVEKFWAAVGPRKHMSWKLKKHQISALSEIVGKQLCDEVCNVSSEEEWIWRPRKLLGPILSSGDNKKKGELAYWIIHVWGGIVTGDNVYDDWLEQLGDFAEDRVLKFADRKRGDRISSWSKLLSFADYQKYPIYDSRTAVSVNVAAERTGCRTFLYMPSPRNDDLPDIVAKLNRKTARRNIWTQETWTYSAYVFLVQNIVNFGLAASVIDAETWLFANAPDLAREWLSYKANKWRSS